MDNCCRAHDLAYGTADTRYNRCIQIVNSGGGSWCLKRRLRKVCKKRLNRDICGADKALIACVGGIGVNVYTWPSPPPSGLVMQAKRYYPRIKHYFGPKVKKKCK